MRRQRADKKSQRKQYRSKKLGKQLGNWCLEHRYEDTFAILGVAGGGKVAPKTPTGNTVVARESTRQSENKTNKKSETQSETLLGPIAGSKGAG